LGYTPHVIASSLARIILSFLFAYVALPTFLFGKMRWDDSFEDFYARVGLAVVLNVMVVYALAATKLYELFSLGLAYLLFWAFRLKKTYTLAYMNELRSCAVTTAFDVFDGLVKVRDAARRYLVTEFEAFLGFLFRTSADFSSVLLSSSFLLIFAQAAYLRFYDAIRNAAPAFSDAYVTLAWMKYVNSRILFHDGIYPQGFHIYLSTISKLSAVNPLLVLKYAGPLNSILIILSIYFAGLALSRRITGGLAAALAYTALTRFLPYEYTRQAATSSQEFALVFLLPCTVFALKYLQTHKKQYLLATAACLTVTGLTHALITIFAVIGIASAVLASLLTGPRRFRFGSLVDLFKGGMIAGAISVLPLLIGMALGIGMHASSLRFAVATSDGPCPPITPFMLAVFSAALLSVLGSFLRRRDPLALPGALTGFLLLCGAMLLYQGPRFGLKSEALNARSGEFAAVAMSVAYGLGWAYLLPYPAGQKLYQRFLRLLTATLTIVLVVGVTIQAKPVPPEPYKMQYNSWVDQYLRITQTCLPSEWLLVSGQEGYALAYGQGWHLMIGDFLSYVSPDTPKLVYNSPGAVSTIDHPYVFIFHERVPYWVDHELVIKMMSQRMEEERRMVEWIERYRRTHDNLSVFYEDKDIVVWVIKQPQDKKETFRRIWGGPTASQGQ